jgi:hypothetical protein
MSGQHVKTTFSFRTECAVDLNKFIVAVDQAEDTDGDEPVLGLFITHANTEESTGESYVEIATYQPVSLEWVRDIMRSIPDSHVMLQTLRQVPLAENSLKRDHTIE